MTSRTNRDWKLATAVALLGACVAPLFLIGCWGGSSAPVVAPDPYAGPAVGLDSAGEYHSIVVQSPSPGYTVTLERVEENRGYDEAFVTIRMPNPRFSFPQMVVEQRALTSVRTGRALRVNARLLGFDATEGAYRAAVFETKSN